MRPILLGRWLLILVVLAIVSLSRRSSAADSQLAIQFLIEPADAPSYLCIVTRLKPLGARNVGELVDASGVKPGADDIIRLPFSKISVKTEKDAHPETVRSDILLNQVAEAARKHEAAAGDQTCAGESGACFPAIHVKASQAQTRFILCEVNKDPTSGAERDAQGRYLTQRIAVVEIDPGPKDLGATAYLDRVSLNGTAAQMILKRAPDGHAQQLTAAVRGGDYANAESGLNVNGRVALRLLPRCKKRLVEIPRIEIKEGSTVTASLVSRSVFVPACRVGPMKERRFPMMIPAVDPGDVKTLSVRVVPAGWIDSEAEFTDHWLDLEAPPVLKVRPAVLSFGWQIDCMYPGETAQQGCPSARIIGVGVTCRAENPIDGICNYRCAPPAAVTSEFDLPARVRFTHGSDESWEAELSFGNQILQGYVPLPERRVEINLSHWDDESRTLSQLTRMPASKIRHVVMWDKSGAAHRVVPRPTTEHISLPGAQCGEVVSYQIEGDREYNEQHREIWGGKIVLGNPLDEVKWITGGIALGGGAAFTPVHLLHFDPNRKYTSFVARPYLVARLDGDLRPPTWPVTLSARVSFMLGEKDYFPIPKPTSTTVYSEFVAFNRLTTELAVSGHIPRSQDTMDESGKWTPQLGYWTVGGGLGAAVEAPLFGYDFRRAGAWHWSPTFSAFGRYFFTRWLSAEFLVRVIFENTVYVSTDYRGEAVPNPQILPIPFVDLSLRYGR